MGVGEKRLLDLDKNGTNRSTEGNKIAKEPHGSLASQDMTEDNSDILEQSNFILDAWFHPPSPSFTNTIIYAQIFLKTKLHSVGVS